MKTSPKVAVILCTYNGSRYISSQIDSILNQDYNNITLYIQDDCSTDDTYSILETYASDKRVKLYKSVSNLGYPHAFYDLLSKVNDADYYAFSDQDDIWNKDKISRAVRVLRKADPLKPAVFFANYDVCDEELNTIRTSVGPRRHPDFLYSLYSCLGLGFTYVINKIAKELIENRRSVKNTTKDVWIGMCCTAFGDAFFDSKPCALHRRHSDAFSAQDRGFISIQKNRFKRFFKNNGLKKVYSVMEEFYEIFSPELPKDVVKDLEFFLYKGFNPIHRMKKVFYPKRLRYDFKDELMLRFIFLMGLL